jgi:hypothetical protein
MTTPEVLALRHLVLHEMERFPQLAQVWREYGPDRARPGLTEALTRYGLRSGGALAFTLVQVRVRGRPRHTMT